ncbi:hypothetical protein [Sediminivirga luteola]|uniref:hypothetical protein n=1 Tax=Sediminivirga luteola TaxID=1774748 RepID=UPI001F56CDD3|nr:hypothetical protein [Sediminivirga luteola]MCI2264246.1 hypothetical protein [Sediminivirga luteola]
MRQPAAVRVRVSRYDQDRHRPGLVLAQAQGLAAYVDFISAIVGDLAVGGVMGQRGPADEVAAARIGVVGRSGHGLQHRGAALDDGPSGETHVEDDVLGQHILERSVGRVQRVPYRAMVCMTST